MIIMLTQCSNLLCSLFMSCDCLSHCDVASFPDPVVLVDLSSDVHQCPFVIAR